MNTENNKLQKNDLILKRSDDQIIFQFDITGYFD